MADTSNAAQKHFAQAYACFEREVAEIFDFAQHGSDGALYARVKADPSRTYHAVIGRRPVVWDDRNIVSVAASDVLKTMSKRCFKNPSDTIARQHEPNLHLEIYPEARMQFFCLFEDMGTKLARLMIDPVAAPQIAQLSASKYYVARSAPINPKKVPVTVHTYSDCSNFKGREFGTDEGPREVDSNALPARMSLCAICLKRSAGAKIVSKNKTTAAPMAAPIDDNHSAHDPEEHIPVPVPVRRPATQSASSAASAFRQLPAQLVSVVRGVASAVSGIVPSGANDDPFADLAAHNLVGDVPLMTIISKGYRFYKKGDSTTIHFHPKCSVKPKPNDYIDGPVVGNECKICVKKYLADE